MIDWLRGSQDAPTIELAGRKVPIELNRHARAKRLTLRLAHDGSAIKITLPRWCPAKDAIAFAAIRRDWLETQLGKVPEPQDPITRGSLRYRGSELRIDWRTDAARRPVLGGEALMVGGPEDTLARRLQRWLEGEALELTRRDAADYCNRAGLSVPQVRLSRAVRRWGSCSSKGILRVNWRLIQAPDAVRRSVVAHEVAHLKHFDHSPEFHALLGAIYEADIRTADGWLKENGRSLYADFG